ncbi:hypothetical protein RMCBS344292_13241 [Rhizopus microsporus]|nr:hypothetical protein RMCBS344292_13241 [Rhizopus microsporus]
MSKILLKEKEVLSIVVETTIGHKAREEYRPWPNGQISDMVYMPPEDSDFSLVIVEIQHVVDVKFIFRLMSYCLQLYNQRGVVPVVFVFTISKIKNEMNEVVKPSKKHSFLLEY